MGLSSSTTTQSNEPSAYAKQFITPAVAQTQAVYDRNAGKISDISSSIQDLIPGLVQRFQQGTPALQGANTYTTDVLNGKYLGQGNPFLEKLIAQTNGDVADKVNASIGTRGLAGGSAQTKLLTDMLAKNETDLRFNDYNTERSRMDNAVGSAATLSGADSGNLAALLSAANAGTTLPFAGTNALNTSLAALLGNSNTTTQKGNNTAGILGGIGSLLSAGALAFSDRRLKRDVEHVGVLDDGLGVYSYRYNWDDELRIGVMADEVADLRPWALGPEVCGFQTVDYGRL